ncbi:MAG: hypothetical protein R2845_06105 [Thermomicrobiales bacterium]
MQLAADQQPGVLDRLARSVGSGATVLVLLLIGEMMLSSRAVVLANWNEDLVALWPLAMGGVVLGVLLSLVRFPDLVGHLIGLFSGVALSLVYATRYLDAPESSMTEKTRALGTLIVDWLRESMSGRQSRDDLVLVTAMGLLLWLIGYISAWFLFRRGWFLPAAVLPGIPIALNLGGIEDGMDAASSSTSFLHFRWQRYKLPDCERRTGVNLVSRSVPSRGGRRQSVARPSPCLPLRWCGTSPVDPPESLMNAAADRLDAPISAVESVWDDLNERLGTPSSGGGFSQFGDSFEMGGELNLSDEPVALLEADRPHYLAAQRYDIYTGQGWTSSAPDQITEVGSGETSIDAPLVAFQADQDVLLIGRRDGRSVRGRRHRSRLVSSGNLLLTIESFGQRGRSLQRYRELASARRRTVRSHGNERRRTPGRTEESRGCS